MCLGWGYPEVQTPTIHYARCLEASFQVIYRYQKGVPTAQNINLSTYFDLSYCYDNRISCFAAIGGAIFSWK